MIVKKRPFGFLFPLLALLFLTLLLNACPNINDGGENPKGPAGEEPDKTGGQPVTGEEKQGGDQTEPPKLVSNVGTRENFWAINVTTNSYYSLNAILLAENDECLVYAECNASGEPVVESAVAEEVAREYLETIMPQMIGVFGEIAHITDKNKLSFLLLDIKDGYKPSKGGGYVAGYFAPEDMENGYCSNKRDMLYIDIDPGLTMIDTLYCTMAHELQHLISYSNTVLKTGRGQDLWINEGLSTAAEYIYGGDPANRVTHYNSDYGNTIKYGNNFFIWDGFWESHTGDSLANYATVYLFFQWLRLHASNDIGIYKDIINSPYTNYRAVTEAARKRIPALGLTGSPEKDWETLLRTWMLSNAVQAPEGLLGYRDQIGEITQGREPKLATSYFADTGKQEWEFYSGEGIFTQINPEDSSYVPPEGGGPNIKYIGFTREGNFDLTAPYEGQFLLTFNANSETHYPSGYFLLPGETGYLAGVLRGPSVQKTFGATLPSGKTRKASARPFSYPVDIDFLRKKQKLEQGDQVYSGGTALPGEE